MKRTFSLAGSLTILALVIGPLAAPTPIGQGHVQSAAAQVAPEISLTVSPSSGPPGTVVQVEGAGFDNSPCGVDLYWDATTGPFLGFASVDNGEFSTQITVPADATPGEHTIIAQGLLFGVEFCGAPSGDEASASFTVTPPAFDYNIYLQRRVLRDPGISQQCLDAIQAANRPTHAIVQLHSLPTREDVEIFAASLSSSNSAITTLAMSSSKIYLPYVARNHSISDSGSDLAVLEELGITLLGYLNGISAPGTAYLASVSPTVDEGDERFQELVRGLVCLEPEDKVQIGLIPKPPGTEPIPVLVQFFLDVEEQEARTLLSALGLEVEQYAPPHIWQTTATPVQIQALANEDLVQWIEARLVDDLLDVDDVRAASSVDAVQGLDITTGVYAGLSGDGVQIAIMDTGVDSQHNDFAGRIIRSQDDSAAHGSHVAGIAAGSGVQSNQNDDANNPNGGTAFQWRGMAPRVQIAAFGTDGSSAGGNQSIMGDAINNFGVDVSNHSYSAAPSGQYNATMESIDSIIRGIPAIPPLIPGVPPRPQVWSAGNGGLTAQYGPNLGYFALTKNCKNCVIVANLTNGLIHNGGSSMGPTMDGRLKPDVAVIGTAVTSVRSDTFAGVGNGYRTTGGTSMASPAVAGIVALMLQQYAQTFGVNLDVAPPLPSTIKAILIQTATDLVGTDPSINPDTGAQVTYGAGPDWATGYGLVDTQAAVQLIEDRGFIEDQLSTTDVTDEFIVSVIPGQTEVQITLAWDDIAGTPNANAAAAQLVNDLDLILIEPGGTVHRPLVLPLLTPRDCDGNAANGVQVGTCPGLDAAGQNYFGPAAEGVDRRNNVEQVVVQNPGGLTPGNWTVRVSVLNDDGVSVRLPLGGNQRYSLAGVTTQRADLEISKNDTQDPVAAGDQLIYTITVTNDGPDTAMDVTVMDTLPPQVTYMSDTAPLGCTQAPVGTLICGLGDLGVNQSKQFDVTVVVDPAVVFDAGGPTTITNTAEVFSSIPDEGLTDNTVSEDTTVVAVADLEIVSFEAVDPPAEILVGEEVDITLRKVITNHGPSAPMDVKLTTQATASSGATVTPANLIVDEPALGLDELRQVDEVFTVSCQEASSHTFTFVNEIQPLNAEDTDPNPANNQAELTVEIECVVPVILNIKPGSFPNSINPRSHDVIPVAILTTSAGEYGTPIDFDATTIDPLSVRFGPRIAVWTETGGAFEAHSRGHIEDSKELDESTRDGDDDMVLHFSTQETGIGAGDTEACVKGEWIDGGGAVHKFFGCDSVRITPGGSGITLFPVD